MQKTSCSSENTTQIHHCCQNYNILGIPLCWRRLGDLLKSQWMSQRGATRRKLNPNWHFERTFEDEPPFKPSLNILGQSIVLWLFGSLPVRRHRAHGSVPRWHASLFFCRESDRFFWIPAVNKLWSTCGCWPPASAHSRGPWLDERSRSPIDAR